MRILAIRGANLASLAEPFAIDLAAEPLDGAGLFAITGETGAGKSTLLDALCLALYGDYPRLGGGSDQDLPDVADQTVKAKDPRTILRRGATHGSAEVDFVGVDGRAYRAHWAVNRARGRAGGRLQPAARHLVRLGPDGTPEETVAEKATAVTAAVEALTDLTYDQFRRTVVLAQGEFDAFLRADERERADLLEKITGTEIYADLSIAAFDRAKTTREAVARARERRDAVGLLAPEVRVEREARRDAIAAERTAIDAHIAVAASAVARHDRVAETTRLCAEAEARETAAAAALAGVADECDRLAAIERAETLRPVFDRLAAARRAEAKAVDAIAEAQARLEAATPRFRDAGAVRAAAVAERDALDARIAALLPQWAAAADLDGAVARAGDAVAAAEIPLAGVRAERDGVARRLAELSHRRATLLAHLTRLAADRRRHPALADLVEHWETIADRLDERLAARATAATAAADAERARADAATIAGRLAGFDGVIERLGTERREAEAALADHRARLADLREEEAQMRDATLARLAADGAEIAPLIREAVAATEAAARAEHERDDARAVIERAAVALPPLEADRIALARRLDEGRSALRLADAVASHEAEGLRDRLVDGAPCPVCGATDHPILADPSIRAALAALRTERAALEAEAGALDVAIADHHRRRDAAQPREEAAARALAEATARRDAAQAAITAADARFAALAHDLDLPWEALGGSAEMRLAAVATMIADARGPVRTRLDAARGLRTEIDGLRERLDRIGRAAAEAVGGRHVEAEAFGAAETRVAVALRAEADARTRVADLDARLAPRLEPLALHPADLDEGGAAKIARLAEAVAARRTLLAEEATATEEEQGLEREVYAVTPALERADRDLAAATATLDARRLHQAQLIAERARLLDGEPTAHHRGRIEAERRRVEVALAEAVVALDATRSEHEAAIVQIGERRTRLAACEAESAHATASCDHALVAADLDLATAAGLLAASAEETAVLSARIEALRTAAARCATEAAARRADFAVAATAAADLAPREVHVAAVDEGRTAVDALNRELGGLAEILAVDDGARLRAADLEAEIAALDTDHAIWAAVDAAIGSADGDRFRKFAQGITLDRLAALADRHLETLAPRYRLVRTGGLGLAIVDRDMGDEMRSTRSLSGGERFLASLSLALSLSGLEGRRSSVDTLFIDEGFGSLDAATLDVAIDALEGLQSQGRKVGVISHVAALHRRIPVQIRVVRAGVGRSRIEVAAGGE